MKEPKETGEPKESKSNQELGGATYPGLHTHTESDREQRLSSRFADEHKYQPGSLR